MNRMIRLFQAKSNLAFEKYLKVRREAVDPKEPPVLLDSPEWRDRVIEGAKFKLESDIWAKAAELLRNEEIKK